MSSSEHSAYKVCSKCGEEKSIGEFYADKSKKDGLRPDCKTCHEVQKAEYRTNHKERVSAWNAEWRKNNPDYFREWREANPDYMHDYMQRWREANPGKLADNYRAWAKANPEKVAANWRNQDARKRNASGSHTAEDIQAQYERQKGCCYWCDCEVGGNYHVDHVMPLSKGGSNGPENLVIACPTCNLRKKDKHPMEFAGVML